MSRRQYFILVTLLLAANGVLYTSIISQSGSYDTSLETPIQLGDVVTKTSIRGWNQTEISLPDSKKPITLIYKPHILNDKTLSDVAYLRNIARSSISEWVTVIVGSRSDDSDLLRQIRNEGIVHFVARSRMQSGINLYSEMREGSLVALTNTIVDYYGQVLPNYLFRALVETLREIGHAPIRSIVQEVEFGIATSERTILDLDRITGPAAILLHSTFCSQCEVSNEYLVVRDETAIARYHIWAGDDPISQSLMKQASKATGIDYFALGTEGSSLSFDDFCISYPSVMVVENGSIRYRSGDMNMTLGEFRTLLSGSLNGDDP